jgi:hypothetical protein
MQQSRKWYCNAWVIMLLVSFFFGTSALVAVLIVYFREAVYRHRGILLENARFEFLLAAMLKIQVSPYAFMARETTYPLL